MAFIQYVLLLNNTFLTNICLLLIGLRDIMIESSPHDFTLPRYPLTFTQIVLYYHILPTITHFAEKCLCILTLGNSSTSCHLKLHQKGRFFSTVKQQMNNWTSIMLISQGRGGCCLEPIPSDFGRKVGFTLYRSPIYHRDEQPFTLLGNLE